MTIAVAFLLLLNTCSGVFKILERGAGLKTELSLFVTLVFKDFSGPAYIIQLSYKNVPVGWQEGDKKTRASRDCDSN